MPSFFKTLFYSQKPAPRKIRRYAIFVFVNVTALALDIYARFIFHAFPPYLPLFLSLAISAYLGGPNLGFISLIFSIMISLLVRYQYAPSDLPLFILWTVVFGIESTFLIWLIDKSRRFDLISHLESREKILLKSLETMKIQLNHAQEEINFRDEFLSIASHELKNPLTAMLLQIQMSLYNIRSVSLAKFSIQSLMSMLEGTENQIQRLSKMISDLSNVSLITTGKFKLEREETDLSKIVQDSVKLLLSKDEAKTKKISLYLDGPVVGKWDKLRLGQVVSNLLTNAIKYGSGNAIEVKLEDTKDKAYLAVKDQGIGIPKDQIDKIFRRFERGTNSRSYQGLGVGLYIVNQIVKAHKGKITLQSSLGKGSTFIVELPKKEKN